MQDDKVSFRLHNGIDVCEIRLPGGNVGVFPWNEVIPGSDPPQNYAERYSEAFEAYKGTGNPRPANEQRAAEPAKRKAKAAKPIAKSKSKAKPAAKKSAKKPAKKK